MQKVKPERLTKKKLQVDLENWIKDTQLFQRIAGTPVSSQEELEKQFWEMKDNRVRQRAAWIARSHATIMNMGRSDKD